MPGDKIERILVAIADPTAGLTQAVRRASALAHGTGASLELFYAIPSAVSAGVAHAQSEHFTRLHAEESVRRLERTANRLRREELIVTTKVQTGYPPAEAILREVRSMKPSLVVIAARKHTALARLLLSQTDFELIRHCPVPLLIVKGRAAWRSPRILAALDPFHANDKPSALDVDIVEAARTIADAVHGSVHAAHIYRPLMRYVSVVPMAVTALSATPEEDKAYRTAVRRGFDETLSRVGVPRNRAHLLSGDPAAEIAALARSLKAGLVVMGAVSRSGLKRIFIGNTAEQALDSIRCDVLVVKARNSG